MPTLGTVLINSVHYPFPSVKTLLISYSVAVILLRYSSFSDIKVDVILFLKQSPVFLDTDCYVLYGYASQPASW